MQYFLYQLHCTCRCREVILKLARKTLQAEYLQLYEEKRAKQSISTFVCVYCAVFVRVQNLHTPSASTSLSSMILQKPLPANKIDIY